MNRSITRLAMRWQKYYGLPSVQVSLGVVMSVLIIAFFLIFAIRPTLATIARLTSDIGDSTKTLQILEAKASALAKANTLYEKLKPKLEILKTSVPDFDPSYAGITKTIETAAATEGVNIASVTLGKGMINSRIGVFGVNSKSNEVVPLPITIRVTGDYKKCMSMANRLSNSKRLISIDTIALGKELIGGKQVNVAGEVSMVLSGNVFYLADKKLTEGK
ncbi:MAG: hypothetical protein E6Q84_01025 [Thiothrix sp.]|nr:MAG: hypothetical protein E6Q84_01025 [Thiothrix sp.]